MNIPCNRTAAENNCFWKKLFEFVTRLASFKECISGIFPVLETFRILDLILFSIQEMIQLPLLKIEWIQNPNPTNSISTKKLNKPIPNRKDGSTRNIAFLKRVYLKVCYFSISGFLIAESMNKHECLSLKLFNTIHYNCNISIWRHSKQQLMNWINCFLNTDSLFLSSS